MGLNTKFSYSHSCSNILFLKFSIPNLNCRLLNSQEKKYSLMSHLFNDNYNWDKLVDKYRQVMEDLY